MNPIKNFLNNILEMKSNKHNLNQGNKFLNNKNKFMVFSKNIETFDGSCNGLFAGTVVNDVIVYTENTEDNKKSRENKDDAGKAKGFPICNNYNDDGEWEYTDSTDENVKKEKYIDFIENKYIPYLKYKQQAFLKLKGDPELGKNFRDKRGNTYFKNPDGQYFIYEDSTGDSSFLPNHVDFPSTCPKSNPTFTETPSYTIDRIDLDPTNKKNVCPPFNDTDFNEMLVLSKQLEREVKEYRFNQKMKLGNVDDSDRNKASINLSNELNIYNDLVKKSKNITDDIKSFDTSREDFLKSISILQIQYGAIGLTSLIFIYLMIKMMSKN